MDNQVEGARYTGRNDVVTNDTDTNVHAVLTLMDTLISAVATLNAEIQKEDGVVLQAHRPQPGDTTAEPTRVLGQYLREVMVRNACYRNFRVFGPDETASNRLDAVYT